MFQLVTIPLIEGGIYHIFISSFCIISVATQSCHLLLTIKWHNSRVKVMSILDNKVI